MPASTIEERVADLEQEVAQLKGLTTPTGDQRPWWEKIRGTFKDDPIYDEAMRMGREWRESQPFADEDSK